MLLSGLVLSGEVFVVVWSQHEPPLSHMLLPPIVLMPHMYRVISNHELNLGDLIEEDDDKDDIITADGLRTASKKILLLAYAR